MKLYFITISFFALLSTGIVYAEENINNNTNIQQNSTSTATNKVMGYKFEPFLLLDGEKFEDISHDDTFVLQNFAITAWINTNQSTLLEPAHIVNKGGFNTDEKGENMNYGIWFSVDGTISGGFETESGEDFEVKSTAKYNDGKWHYVLLSYDGSLLRLDIDGKKQVSPTKNTNRVIPDTTGDQPLRIGANSLDESKFFTGNIDEVRVWNRGLTDEEISEIYTNNIFDSNGQIIYLDFGGDGDNFSSQSLTQKIIDKKEGIKQGEGPSNDITNTIKDFNIAVSADWGCEEDTEKTAKNIQKKSPELVIAAGDLSYEESADCWFEIIEPFVSKMKIAMGDHEYSDTSGGAIGIINQYLKPLNLAKTYYSFHMNNVHVSVIDPYIDYKPGSSQYQFIENELKTASTNPKIDWTFVVESIPIYTSPAQHPGNSTIRDIYHPLF
ncbi:MAG TPA: LamG-like jellyroll fold domain-containing protein, partial [Nitrososphaeraceae archaeon]